MNRKRAMGILLSVICLTGCNRPEYVAPTVTETSVPTATPLPFPPPVREINLPVPPEEATEPLPPFTRDNPATDLADIVPLLDHIKAQFFAQIDRPGWYGRKSYNGHSYWLHISDPESKTYDGYFTIMCYNELNNEPCKVKYFYALVNGAEYNNWTNGTTMREIERPILQGCDLRLNGDNPCRLAVFGGDLYVHDHINSLLSRDYESAMRSAWFETREDRISLFHRIINEDTHNGYKDETKTVRILSMEILTEFNWETGDIVSEERTYQYGDGTDQTYENDAQWCDGLKLVCYGEELPPDIQPAYDLAMSLIEEIN